MKGAPDQPSGFAYPNPGKRGRSIKYTHEALEDYLRRNIVCNGAAGSRRTKRGSHSEVTHSK